jgi:hypothetical protein
MCAKGATKQIMEKSHCGTEERRTTKHISDEGEWIIF